MRECRKENKMKEEKVIAIVEEGVKVHGVKEDDIIPWLIHALVECFNKQMGPINCTAAGKKIIDLLMDARMMERMNIMWDVFDGIFGDGDDDDDEDDED